MGPFEKPVNTAVFTDYTSIVEQPIDLQQIERRIKSNGYPTPEDFEYDIQLIFKNCETYNATRNGQHLIAMAKYGARKFRMLFYNKLKAQLYETSSWPSAYLFKFIKHKLFYKL